MQPKHPRHKDRAGIMDPYIAHRREEDKKIQSVSEHNRETADIAKERCAVENMVQIVYLAGMFHDAGKYSEAFQEYIKQAGEEQTHSRRGDVNHATAGGALLEEAVPKSNLSEMIQTAIYSHHGVYDAINMEKGEALIEKRQSAGYQEKEKIELENVRQRFYQFADEKALSANCSLAKESLAKLISEIKVFSAGDTGQVYGSRDFYMGMQERLLMSLLIDADRSNTAEFMNQMPEEKSPAEEKNDRMKRLWKECIDSLEKRIAKF